MEAKSAGTEHKNAETKFAKEESFALFTLVKHDGRLTLRNIKFRASDSSEFDSAISKHPGQFLVVKKNKVMKTNCFNSPLDFQRLLGFAVLEGTLKPKIEKFEHSDQKYLTWVEGSGDLKDIVWKSVHGPTQKDKITSLFEKHDDHGDGPVVLTYAPKSSQLHVVQHNNSEHMPK